MSRLEGKCTGDCTKCKLLEDGRVAMEVCMLDQVFQRIQKIERTVSVIHSMLEVKDTENKTVSLVRENAVTEEAER